MVALLCDVYETDHMDAEVVLVMTSERQFAWQTTLPVDELPARLRKAAERLEEQIARGDLDCVLVDA